MRIFELSNSRGPHGVFGQIVIRTQPSVFQIVREGALLIQAMITFLLLSYQRFDTSQIWEKTTPHLDSQSNLSRCSQTSYISWDPCNLMSSGPIIFLHALL